MHIDSLPEASRSLLLTISEHCADIGAYLLVGGTALTLQIAHRLSEDLDFALPERKLDRAIIKAIARQLQVLGKVLVYNNRVEDIENAIEHGIDLDDYQQNYLVDDVKLTFFAYGDDETDRELIRQSLLNPSKLGFVNVADAQTIFTTKCICLTDRVKSRDLYDLWRLTRAGSSIGSTQSIFETIQRYRPTLPYEHVRHRLLDWKIGATDELFASLIDDGATIESIRDDFRKEVCDLELRMASAIARQRRGENGGSADLPSDAKPAHKSNE